MGKAEILDKGQNPRFVVTNLPAEGLSGEPQERFAAPALYDKLYCARVEMENGIKEAQQDLFADRTSTSWMASDLKLSFSSQQRPIRPRPGSPAKAHKPRSPAST